MIHSSVLFGVLALGSLAGATFPWWIWPLWLVSVVLLGDS